MGARNSLRLADSEVVSHFNFEKPRRIAPIKLMSKGHDFSRAADAARYPGFST